jgi:hypothetical protein
MALPEYRTSLRVFWVPNGIESLDFNAGCHLLLQGSMRKTVDALSSTAALKRKGSATDCTSTIFNIDDCSTEDERISSFD